MGADSAYEWCINRRRETYRSAAWEVYGDDYCRAEVADPSDGRVTRTHAHTREPADKQLRTLFGEPRRLDRHTTVADDFWVHALCVCELIRSNIVWVNVHKTDMYSLTDSERLASRRKRLKVVKDDLESDRNR